MKRLFLSVAVLAVAASCSKNEVTEISASQQQVIGFTNLNDRVTKAANDASDNYYVYAKSTSDASSWFMTEEINGKTDGDATVDDIKSGNVYYWPSSSTVNFYAFAPAAANSTNLSVTDVVADETLKLVYTVDPAAAEDFTVATPILAAYSTDQDGTTGTDSAPTSAVPLVFSHMLTKATVAVTIDGTSLPSYTYSFTGATLTVANETVTVSLANTVTSSNFAAAAVASDEDGTDSAKAETPYTLTTDGSTAYAAAAATSSATSASQALLFAPQPASGTEGTYYVTLKGLQIKNSNGSVVYGGTAGADTKYLFSSTQVFAAGTSYAITLTISADDEDLFSGAIAFSSDIVPVGWGSDTVGLDELDDEADTAQ